jgi:hypothetical protein
VKLLKVSNYLWNVTGRVDVVVNVVAGTVTTIEEADALVSPEVMMLSVTSPGGGLLIVGFPFSLQLT